MQYASGIPVCTLQDGGVEDEHLANSQDWDGATIQYSGLMDLLRRTSGGMIQWTNVVSFILLRRHRTTSVWSPPAHRTVSSSTMFQSKANTGTSILPVADRSRPYLGVLAAGEH